MPERFVCTLVQKALYKYSPFLSSWESLTSTASWLSVSTLCGLQVLN